MIGDLLIFREIGFDEIWLVVDVRQFIVEVRCLYSMRQERFESSSYINNEIIYKKEQLATHRIYVWHTL